MPGEYVERVSPEVLEQLRDIIRNVHPDEVPWFRGMPLRARVLIMQAYRDGDIPNLQTSSVRAKGAAYWRRKPTVGPKTFAAISAAVGGFGDAKSTADLRRLRLDNVVRVLTKKLDRPGGS